MFRDVLRRRRCAVPGGELHPCDHGAERAGGEGARPDAGDAVSRRVNKPENARPELIQLDESAKELRAAVGGRLAAEPAQEAQAPLGRVDRHLLVALM